MKPHYHVAVGVVKNALGEVLLTQRPPGKHQAGKWEFAGGKVEPGETVQEALVREFDEELGLLPKVASPLITIPFEYPEHTVLLDTWEISAFDGAPESREGQAFRWVPPHQLFNYEFPTANRAIIRAVQLPQTYLITPEDSSSLSDFLERFEQAVLREVTLCRIRQGSLSEADYEARVRAALALGLEVAVLVDGPPSDRFEGVAGWHLNSKDLYHYQERPLGMDQLLFASLHTQADLLQANKLQVDASVLSPVLPTLSHPGAPTLGWEQFAALATQAQHPVYALGGLTVDDIQTARQHGGQGIAAIRGLW